MSRRRASRDTAPSALADRNGAPDELTGRRVRREAAELARTLPRTGSVVRRADQWPGTVEQWHHAADAAAEAIRRPVRSGVSARPRTLWALVTDWPRTPDELIRAAGRLRLLGRARH